MLRFNRILLASDFSPSAEAALHYAATLARQSQARLVVLHVVDTRVAALPRWSDIFQSTEVFADLEANQTDALGRLLTHPALTGLTVERLMQQGHPATHIIDVASQVDLVVIGTRGAGSGWGKTSGRVARTVAHGCPVPVLLVPEGGGHAGIPAAGANRLSLQRLLLALHFAQYAPQALTLFHTLANIYKATSQVLQVVEPDKVTTYPLDAGAGLYHNVGAVKTLLRQRLAEIVPHDPAQPPVERLILEGNAAEVILRQSITYRTDLVVMSVHAYGTLQKFFTLSTVDAVIERTPCPVLAVPFTHAMAG
jgi:nucleotide-binding universal stress UspA family protein